jgi:hypothetical protein
MLSQRLVFAHQAPAWALVDDFEPVAADEPAAELSAASSAQAGTTAGLDPVAGDALTAAIAGVGDRRLWPALSRAVNASQLRYDAGRRVSIVDAAAASPQPRDDDPADGDYSPDQSSSDSDVAGGAGGSQPPLPKKTAGRPPTGKVWQGTKTAGRWVDAPAAGPAFFACSSCGQQMSTIVASSHTCPQ